MVYHVHVSGRIRRQNVITILFTRAFCTEQRTYGSIVLRAVSIIIIIVDTQFARPNQNPTNVSYSLNKIKQE